MGKSYVIEVAEKKPGGCAGLVVLAFIVFAVLGAMKESHHTPTHSQSTHYSAR